MNRWSENSVAEAAHTAAESSRELVVEHPISSLMIAFGAGLGAGIALVGLLAPRPEPAGLSQRLAHQLHDALATISPGNLRQTLRS